ncbi:hypothetical protein [Flavobacterium sp. C4GT6]|uniref:hypothetical protein n=1 Tax=Flavobacterium sp. C4GT6 TaxID=3103818 RepID=UPI002ED1F8F3
MELSLESLLSILAIFLSIVSLWASWHLSDVYGLKNKIYEKRLSAALDLIEAIKSLSFNSHMIDKDVQFLGGFDTLKFKNYFRDDYEAFKESPLYFAIGEYYMIFKKLKDLQSNPYLDKKIVRSLDFLNTLLSTTDTSYIRNGVILTQEYNYQGRLCNPESFSSLEEYIDNMENILKVTTKWLRKKSRLNEEFNI